VDVALTLRQLRAVLIHDQRQVSVSLKILKLLLKKSFSEIWIRNRKETFKIKVMFDVVLVVAIAVSVVVAVVVFVDVGNVGF
jgi:hypothetical protein